MFLIGLSVLFKLIESKKIQVIATTVIMSGLLLAGLMMQFSKAQIECKERGLLKLNKVILASMFGFLVASLVVLGMLLCFIRFFQNNS